MAITFMQKSDREKKTRKIHPLTKLATLTLLVVATVDFYLWLSNQQIFTSFFQSYTTTCLAFS